MRKLLTGALAFMMVASMVGCGNRDVASDIPVATVGVDFIHDDPKPTTEAVAEGVTVAATERQTVQSETKNNVTNNSETKKAESATKESATKAPVIKETAAQKETQYDPTPAKYVEVSVPKLTGKTLKQAMDAGYDYNGCSYGGVGGKMVFDIALKSHDMDANIQNLLNEVSTKTVAQLKEKYGFSFFMTYDQWEVPDKFSTKIGSVVFSYDLEKGKQALKEYEESHRWDISDCECIQNDKLLNVKVEYIELYAVADEKYYKAADEADEASPFITFQEELMKFADEMVLKRVYYEVAK